MLVIDYKYSSSARQYKTGTEDGSKVQAGLYLMGARQKLGLQPAAMLYVTLRQTARIEGWHVDIPALRTLGVEERTPAGLEEIMREARENTLNMVSNLRAGRIGPEPGILRKCRYCEFAEVCRSEAVKPQVAGGRA
jgi:CRISPR/Cas system-associated exonuclease Cas4 (RecB family)